MGINKLIRQIYFQLLVQNLKQFINTIVKQKEAYIHRNK